MGEGPEKQGEESGIQPECTKAPIYPAGPGSFLGQTQDTEVGASVPMSWSPGEPSFSFSLESRPWDLATWKGSLQLGRCQPVGAGATASQTRDRRLWLGDVPETGWLQFCHFFPPAMFQASLALGPTFFKGK